MKKELIEKIMYDGGIVKDSPLGRELVKSLEKHLPDFNPYKIDEERYRRIYDRVGHMEVSIKEYNSTLPEGLKPLPKEMPKEFAVMVGGMGNAKYLWQYVLDTYGTPESNLQPLPSVEDLEKELEKLWINAKPSKALANYLHSKYGTQPREWWEDLKEGISLCLRVKYVGFNVLF